MLRVEPLQWPEDLILVIHRQLVECSAMSWNHGGDSRPKVRSSVSRLGVSWYEAILGNDQDGKILIHGKSVI